MSTPFVIKHYDKFAVEVINRWINLAVKNKVNIDKINRARKHRDEIKQWQLNNLSQVKLPD
jgi:hypothetical protein